MSVVFLYAIEICVANGTIEGVGGPRRPVMSDKVLHFENTP